MKITVLGSCRQYSLKDDYVVTNIQEGISYPHYSKEILQVINFCKFGNLTEQETLYTFRTAILHKNPIYFTEELKNEFNSSDLFIIEIASKLKYQYNDTYVHHISVEDEYNVSIKNDIVVSKQTKEEIEEDIIKIREVLNKPIIIVSHLVTRDYGERYLLKLWLEEICLKYNILFIDPVKEIKQKNVNLDDMFIPENILAHYTDYGHTIIKEIYKENITKLFTKKTFIFVPTYNPCNIQDDTTYFWGLGDIIRGIITMFQLSKKYNFHLIVDFQHVSFCNYLKSVPHKYSSLILENKHNIPFILDNEIESYIHNNSNEVCFLFTNSHLRGDITQECKEFIKNILTPNEEFQKYIDETFLRYNIPENYHILHFRLGDSFLIKNQEGNYSNAIDKMNEWSAKDDVLISDSLIFKEKIKETNKNVIILDTEPVHLGYKTHSNNINNINNIKDTLLEFFIITKCKNIKTFSIYQWISGFVNIGHIIYDIPLVRI